ncbi:MAG: putative lipid II flippase FtsW [Devosiaceae bacterium]|nr:putative lipid II flippase FtsW [Devosiaceae bacterium]
MFSREKKTLIAEWWWTIDRTLLAALIMLLLVGVVLSFAASPSVAVRLGYSPYHFVIRHIVFIIPTIIVLIGASLLNERLARFAALLMFVGSLILLWATPFIGFEANGASRWIIIFGQSIQPSEFIKPSYALIAAWLFSLSMQQKEVPGKIISFILAGLIIIPLLMQPDLGQSFLVGVTFFALLFLAGLSWFWIFLLFGVSAASGFGAYLFFPHFARRIDGFINQGSGGPSYQVEKALQSLLEGGWFGRGPGEATAKNYIPDAHADYVFSAAAGEFGIIFSLMLASLIGFIIIRSLSNAQNQTGLFARLGASILAIQFGLQSIINLAVNLNLMPSKGMTLPFVSYGGTSMLAIAFSMGILLSLTRKKPHERLLSVLPLYQKGNNKMATGLKEQPSEI